jgi:hypothetical protein
MTIFKLNGRVLRQLGDLFRRALLTSWSSPILPFANFIYEILIYLDNLIADLADDYYYFFFTMTTEVSFAHNGDFQFRTTSRSAVFLASLIIALFFLTQAPHILDKIPAILQAAHATTRDLAVMGIIAFATTFLFIPASTTTRVFIFLATVIYVTILSCNGTFISVIITASQPRLLANISNLDISAILNTAAAILNTAAAILNTVPEKAIFFHLAMVDNVTSLGDDSVPDATA